MTRDYPVNTRTGVELVRKLVSEGDCIFTSARARELAPSIGLAPGYLSQALHHHGLTEQVPREVFVLTTTEASVPRRRGSKDGHGRDDFTVVGTSYQFVQVKPDRFFGMHKVWIGDARVTITDPERTLLDGLSMPQYCGDFAEVLHAFETRGTDLDLPRMIEYALRLDAATAKPLGWVLERQDVDLAKARTARRAPPSRVTASSIRQVRARDRATRPG